MKSYSFVQGRSRVRRCKNALRNRARPARALYKNCRRDGKIVTDYLGTGPDAESIFEKEQRRRADDEARATAQQAQRERWQAAMDKSDAFGDKVRQLAHATLIAGGYHLHACSSWRKKKMAVEVESAVAAYPTMRSGQSATNGDETVRPLLADFLRATLRAYALQLAQVPGDSEGLTETAPCPREIRERIMAPSPLSDWRPGK